MLVMDSSGGVMKDNWYKVLHFANRIVSQFDVSPQAVHIGVITYASHAEISLSLGKHDTKNDVSDAIDVIPFMGGATNTHSGFLMMRAHFSSIGRPNVRKIAILITDGQTAMPNLAIQQASYARSEGIQLYVAGVDKHFDYSEAARMVSDKNRIIQIETFKDMVSPILNYELAVKEKICGEGEYISL
jgi:Mg-chelatase subunit ChlD